MIVRKMRFSSCFLTALLMLLAALTAPAQSRSTSDLSSQRQAATSAVAFQKWVDRYQQQPGAVQAGMEQEGVTLARQRRSALLELAKVNPSEALSLALSTSAKSQLPAGLANELETRVSGIGDLSVLIFCPRPGGGPVLPMQRWVTLNGKEYEAYVYGRRAGQTTKQGIPLSGIVIDGVLILDESPVRVLDADEPKAGAHQAAGGSAGIQPGASPVVAEIGGKLYRFDSSEHLQRVKASLEAAEAGLGPIPAKKAASILEIEAANQKDGGGVEDPPTPWTTGLKRILVIRVDFSDLPGDPAGFGAVYTPQIVQGVADQEVAPFYAVSSYGLTSLSNVVTTQLYRMPNTAESYATAGNNAGLHTDARTLAAADYTLADYDRICVLFSWLGDIPGSFINYGGLANLGGPYLWVNGEFDFRVYSHELGHTYGLLHAGLWDVSDGNPISPGGAVIEYGDDFDTMGANFANDPRADFNPYYKNRLGWISDSQVLSVGTLPGTYRIYTFDYTNTVDAPTAPLLGLQIVKDNTKSYWVGLRHNFPNNPFLENGVYVIWGYNTPGAGGGGGWESALLDMVTPGNSLLDSPLPNGATFIDSDIGLAIRPINPGGDSPNRFVDIEINGGVPNPNLAVATSYLLGGNGNGTIDPNECNDLFLVLTNAGNAPATQVQVTLSTTTPGVTFGERNSDYLDFAVGASGTNLTGFKISTSPTFVCGTPIDVLVQIKSDQRTSSTNVNLASGATGVPKQYDSTGPIAIRDADPVGTNSTITVTNLTSAIRKATVSVFITHTFVFDLYFELIGPDGTRVLLSDHNGGGGNNYGTSCSPDTFRTTFDDAAVGPISGGLAPFVGTFRPEQPLSAFIGKSGTNANGDWKLRVVDDIGQDVGILQCWSLNLSTAICTDGGGTCPGADLAVGLTDSPDPVFIGSNIFYTINVTNNGPSQATNVVVNQLLPPSVVFVSATASQGSVTHAGGTVIGNIGTLPVGGRATIDVRVIPTLSAVISSSVAVSSEQPDPNTANNVASVSTRVNPPSSDLVVGLLDSPDPVLVGESLTYTVTVVNNGPSTASGVTVTNTLPPSALVQAASASQGNAFISGNIVIFSFGALGNAAQATGTITVTPTAEGTIVATAVARANQVDPQTANNTITAATVVGPSADLALTMADAPDPVVVRSNWTYTITVTNNGPSSASAAVVNHTLPAGVNLVSNSTTLGTISGGGGVVSVNLGTLAKGVGAVIRVTVNATNAGNYVSSVTATAAQTDSHPENNSLEASTLVALPFVKIETAGATLTAENFSPPDGSVSVGETVTVQLRLRNTGNVNNTNLTATLLATGGVTSPSPAGPVAYGVLTASGSPVTQPFTFTASGTNGGTVVATLQLQDAGNPLTNVTFVFKLPTVLTFSNTAAITIPDSGSAAPYPSAINVSGITGLVGKVTATLSNLNHTYPQDVDVLLVAPGGIKTILMASAGAPFVSSANVTFDDGAAIPIPSSGSISSGSYRPASYGAGGSLPAPAPVSPYPEAMSVFNGLNPNGQWSLFAADHSAGDAGNILGGWRLSIAVVSPVNQVADLGVVAATTPGSVFVAESVTCVFTITNRGPNTATSAAFTNLVPAGAVLVSAASSQGVVTTNAASVVVNLSDINAGASATVTVVVQPTVAGILTLTGNVASSETDLNPANNEGSANTTVNAPFADLTVAATASTSTVVEGSNVTFTVSVTNLGPQQALGTTISDPLPPGLNFVSTTASSFTNSAGTVLVSLGNLASGGFATFDIVANAAGLGQLTNMISGATASSDTNSANNVVALVLAVNAPAPIITSDTAVITSESISPPNASVDIGETVTVSLSLRNVGPAATANLVATLQSTGGVSSPSGPQNYGALAQGGSAVARPFTFIAGGTNGGVVIATLALQDGTNSLGDAAFTFVLPGTTSFTNSTAISIPGQGSASPYPSSIEVSGLIGQTTKAVVTLFGVSHGFPDDVDILLVGPNGKKLVLMSDAGGGHNFTNRTLVFDDAGGPLPDASAIASGTYKPTDYESGDVFPPPAPAGSLEDSLAAFNGDSPNGTWSLYVTDDSTGDSGIITGGWSLTLTTISAINPLADLEITLTGFPGSLYVGSGLTYDISVINHGPTAATGVTVTDALPSDVNFVSATSSQGTVNNSGGVVTFNLGNLAASASATASIRVAPSLGGTLVNSAIVTGVESDLSTVNNSAQTSITVLIPQRAVFSDVAVTNAQLQFTLTGDPGMAYVIQGSTNLTTWTSLATNTAASNGTIKFTDVTAPSYTLRFYRAVRLIP